MPTLLEALEQKYGWISTESDCSEDEGISISIFVPCKSPRAAVPALLVLNDCDITSAGEKNALKAKCGSVEELDLAKNKLNEWSEVFKILEPMPSLKFVNLSFNVLSSPIKEQKIFEDLKWRELRNLVLNSTYIKWESVLELLDCIPCLEELHLSLNDYNSVCLHHERMKCSPEKNDEEEGREHCTCDFYKSDHKHIGIRTLHFNGNPVNKWMEVTKLGYAFPNLESLVLADCPISSLNIHDIDDATGDCLSANNNSSACASFGNLRTINMNSTNLSTWDDIDQLAKFPLLECVRIQGCPLWEKHEYTEHERRQLLIARLPNVKTLNGGGVITPVEREDAERAFIRYYMDKPESDQPERYFDLIQIHGKLDPLVNIDLRPEKRVKIKFTLGETSEIKLIDVHRTVFELKSKLEGFAGFHASKMRLFYVDQDLRDMQGPEEMRFPNKRLYSYNIRFGDEIIIECKKKPGDSVKR
ncbi:unnamed protein product [Phaedon cochleariae]|uniref:Tubulin-specific chaperone cofactor E-like protein n=1 Tax=Phaedon cochleariae TaxID=80249 RepID=A0A9P0GN44_PHACE|nr:unnamed protein product [Phaedon cochleariae]